MSSRETMEYLLSCFDAMYQVLGASAPNLTNDAYVVRTYETGRAMGEVALSLREYLGEASVEPLAAVRDTLLEAVANDLSGAMVLYCVATVVGPRVLVSLRDARERVDLDDAAREVLGGASESLVREMLAVAHVADAGAIEDRHWQERARGLADGLEAQGYAESFGITR